jgi:DNA-binding HxlR family transcriptional regulator
MALPKDYSQQLCSLARALEVVGERWTLLILRDAYYGVRRFSDFRSHLQIPRAVLSERLAALVEAGLLVREPSPARPGGHDEYVTTEKGRELWPAMLALMSWGDAHYAPEEGPRRRFRHERCGTDLDPHGWCPTCAARPPLQELLVLPGPGLEAVDPAEDRVTESLRGAHRMLEPVR